MGTCEEKDEGGRMKDEIPDDTAIDARASLWHGDSSIP